LFWICLCGSRATLLNKALAGKAKAKAKDLFFKAKAKAKA